MTTPSFQDLFAHAARLAADFREGLPTRRVGAVDDEAAARARWAAPLPTAPTAAGDVLNQLVTLADPGITASAGPRFFGFVNGGALPAASAADMLVTGWDHPAFNTVLAPAAAAAEATAGGWVKEILGIPSAATVGFVTGAQASNTVGIAAARHQLLADRGWDVRARGLYGAPQVRVVAGAERHATIDASLRFLGLGTDSIAEVAAGPNGEMDMADLERVLAAGEPGAPTLVVLQSGNVNTGAFDDLRRGCDLARAYGAWAHVDGAFGMWVGASARLKHLLDGVELADSWCLDAHKWLNVPYDSALAICAHPEAHSAAMSYSAAYLTGSEQASFGPGDLVPESSRRARGFAVWAAIRELGTAGIGEMVERCCDLATRFAERLAAGGARILNDVVINQILIDFPGCDADELSAAIQAEGTCWLGATTWRGQRLLRVSVSNYSTTAADIDASADAMIRVAAGLPH